MSFFQTVVLNGLALLLVLLLGLCPSETHAQGISIIRGRVMASNAAVVDRVEVLLERAEGYIVARAFADSSGEFEFREATGAGRYEIVVRAEGYNDARQSVELGSTWLDNIFVDGETEREVQQPAAAGSTLVDGVYNVTILLTQSADGDDDSPREIDPDLPNPAEWNRRYSRRVLQEYERALDENRQGDAVQAAERLEDVLERAPDFYYARYSLGTIYHMMERLEDAEREYNLARQLNPDFSLPLVNLGSLYIQQADAFEIEDPDSVGIILDKALDILEEAIDLRPDSSFAYHLLGTAYYKSAFYEEAEANFLREIEIGGNTAAARLMLANVYIRQQDWTAAIEQLDTYLAENPDAADRDDIEAARARLAENIEEVTP